MSVIFCPNCNVANFETAQRCHCCTARLRRTTKNESSETSVNQSPDQFCYAAIEQRRHAWSATKALISAAMMSVIRATVIPYLVMKTPPGTLGQIDPQTVEIMGFFLVVVFGIAGFFAMTKPLISVSIAFALYLATAIPDLLQHEGFLGRGVLSKSVMILVLIRALIAALQHQMLSRQSPAPTTPGSTIWIASAF